MTDPLYRGPARESIGICREKLWLTRPDLAWGRLQAGVDLGRIENQTELHDQARLAEVADPPRRVAVDQDDVGQEPLADRAEILVPPHDPRRLERRDTQDLRRRNTGLGV